MFFGAALSWHFANSFLIITLQALSAPRSTPRVCFAMTDNLEGVAPPCTALFMVTEKEKAAEKLEWKEV